MIIGYLGDDLYLVQCPCCRGQRIEDTASTTEGTACSHCEGRGSFTARRLPFDARPPQEPQP